MKAAIATIIATLCGVSFQRPSPDLQALNAAWKKWVEGEEPLAGRTMADLKIAGADLVLQAIEEQTQKAEGEDTSAESEQGSLLAVWNGWEDGSVHPKDTLEALEEHGMGEVVAALIEE